MINLILGTATFGTGYGVANSGKTLEKEQVREVLAVAQDLGINEFDTAPTYGTAEIQLGDFLDHSSQPSVSSKICKENAKSVKLMLASVNETLSRTKVSKLQNLYLHDPDALSGEYAGETIAGLKEIIDLGLANRVGVSVYSLQALLRAKKLFPGLTVFQVPENICDRRLFNSSELVELKNEGNQFIIRSIFLQGLLLMSPADFPKKFQEAKTVVLQLRTLADFCDVLPLDLCLAYGQKIPWASGIIIGAASSTQLRQAIESRVKLPTGWESIIDTLPLAILDPTQW
jgi:aryl-alcohol dehydrogenase-like predicted oxidoreductase